MMCLRSDTLAILFPDLFNDFFIYLAYNPKVQDIFKLILGKTILSFRNLPRKTLEKLHL